MKKIVIVLLVFTVLIYLCFAIIPEYMGIYLPTGGWDWLSFTGIIMGLLVTVWGVLESIKKNAQVAQNQLIMSVKPFLDINATNGFDINAPNNVYRRMNFDKDKILNTGFELNRTKARHIPTDFVEGGNFTIKNVGLSTAFNITVSLHKLLSVVDVDNLDNIQSINIDDFYSKILIEDYVFYEHDVQKKERWIISPAYNLSISDEFNLVFDFSGVTCKNHCILQLDYEDVYGTLYFQYAYLYFDKQEVWMLPPSSPK